MLTGLYRTACYQRLKVSGVSLATGRATTSLIETET